MAGKPWCLLLTPDDEDLLEFSYGVPKHFPFFHRDPRSGAGCTQCCQEILAGVKVVLNFFGEVQRREVHGATAFLIRCRRSGLERSSHSAGHDCSSYAQMDNRRQAYQNADCRLFKIAQVADERPRDKGRQLPIYVLDNNTSP